MRYESCDTTARNPLSENALRNCSAVTPSMDGSRHWLGVLVKSWIAVAPMATPRAGAVATPPCVLT